MTTVLVTEDRIVADTVVTADVAHRASKIFRLNDGSLLGAAGGLNQVHSLVKYLNDEWPLDEPPAVDEVVALRLSEDGIELFDGCLVSCPLPSSVHAVGSGGAVAIGAHAAGASPEEAVEIATRYDIYSRAPVEVVML